jgi:hypothetical protein
MLPAPSWMYYTLGALMFVVAAYGGTLLLLSLWRNRRAGRDVETSHVAMGLAMAGMFVPAWAFGSGTAWILVFIGFLTWFVVRSVQSIERFGLHVPHTAIHAVMSFAMLLMYWFPMASGSGSMDRSMSMGSSSSHGVDPALAFLIAFVLFGSAIFTIASPNKGATHYGTHDPNALSSAVVADTGSHGEKHLPTPAELLERPSLLDASHVVMSAAMGLMLILMI